jgi:D-alanyl-D-alanine carboxypeptidase/D-alanyl-D-alanine-endopeptidase (penicillin-binding protein 4)
MQNAEGSRSLRRARLLFAFCIVHFAFLSCAKRPPVAAAPAPTTQADPLALLRQDILSATNNPGVRGGVWGVIVYSMDREERLFEVNPRFLLVPASVAKLASVATAADAVGWNYRYVTTLRASGPIADGVLRGDLMAVGSGDPSIGGQAGEDFSSWTDGLKGAGIRRIEGRIIGDDDALEEPRPQLAWAWDDLGYTTGAIYGALNVAENRTAISITPGAFEGAPTSISVDPRAAYRTLMNRSITGAPGSTQLMWPEQRPGEPALTIAGSIPVGSPPVTIGIAVGNPTLWFANVLRSRLLRDGIEVTGDAVDIDDVKPPPDRAAATTIFTHRSRTLAEIAQPLLKDSINLYAEACLRLNAAPGTFPTNDAALDGFRARLEAWGIPRDSEQLVDGSGLSRRDTISAEALLTILRRMYVATGTSPFMTGLPVAGVDGSLAARMKGTPADGNLRAKTGTMSNIRSLAGYVTTREGEHLAVVIMVNNFEGTGAQANDAIDRIAVRLASFSRRSLSAGPRR